MSWPEEMHARNKARQEKENEEIRAMGFRLISCLSYSDPRTNECLMTSWMGETRRVVMTNAPERASRYGISRILVGPNSKIVEIAEWNSLPVEQREALQPNAVSMTVFSLTTVRNP